MKTAILALLLVFISAAAQEQPTISLVTLVAMPERYHGKPVVVSGFMYLQREHNALYIGKSDFQHGALKNAVYLQITNDLFEHVYRLNGCYVVVSGTFDGKNTGHLGLFSGELTMTKVSPASTFIVPKNERDNADPPACK